MSVLVLCERPATRVGHDRGVEPDPLGLTSAHPAGCHGRACIRGTRIPVSVGLDALAEGMSEAEIPAGYPTLTVEGIRAAAGNGGPPP